MLDSDADVPQEILVEYEKLLKKSYTEDFDELYNTDLLKIIGKDGNGSYIVLLVPCFIVLAGSDPEKILKYVILRLDPIVKGNYVLIICETHTNWLTDTVFAYAKLWYDTLPRKYKKNLKKLYLVHSGFLSKTILAMLKPFISEKFWKKVEYIEKLEQLFLKLNIQSCSHLRHFPYIVQRHEEIMLDEKSVSIFGVGLEVLCQRIGRKYKEFNHIPSIVVDFLNHLSKPEIINTKDLFYLQTDANMLYEIIGDIEYGEPTTDFNNIPALVCSFKLFLDVQKHGLLGKRAFLVLHQLQGYSASDKRIKVSLHKLYQKLDLGVQQCILCLLNFFQTVSKYSNENNMTPAILSKIFSSTFFRSTNPNANFVECINIANKCLEMLIVNPNLLTDTKINSDSEEIESSDSISDDEDDDKRESNILNKTLIQSSLKFSEKENTNKKKIFGKK